MDKRAFLKRLIEVGSDAAIEAVNVEGLQVTSGPSLGTFEGGMLRTARGLQDLDSVDLVTGPRNTVAVELTDSGVPDQVAFGGVQVAGPAASESVADADVV